MDLHAWITQQVDRVEASAHARLKGLRVAFEPHGDGPAMTGTVTGAARTAEGLQLDVVQYGADPVDDAWANVPHVAAVLRRCEADRWILERHHLATEWTWQRDPACHGCGTQGDCDDPVTDNINDCPELRDLGHAHGLTDEILAGFDRPQPPESVMRIHKPRSLADILATRPITTSDVPEALRGHRWKP